MTFTEIVLATACGFLLRDAIRVFGLATIGSVQTKFWQYWAKVPIFFRSVIGFW